MLLKGKGNNIYPDLSSVFIPNICIFLKNGSKIPGNINIKPRISKTYFSTENRIVQTGRNAFKRTNFVA